MVLPQIDSFKREPISPSGSEGIKEEDPESTTIMWGSNDSDNYDAHFIVAPQEQSYSSMLGSAMPEYGYGNGSFSYPNLTEQGYRLDHWPVTPSSDSYTVHQSDFPLYSSNPNVSYSTDHENGTIDNEARVTQPVYQDPAYFYPNTAFGYERKPIKRTNKGRKNTKRPLTSDEAARFTEQQRLELTPNHKNSIHLWQFLAELLNQDKWKCIKWVHRDQGIFKIEDSQEVAKLWGLRKNRPNMNYDKLSRSIRQYYKKGIIRKPTVSSRLVYQFCDKILTTL